MFISADAFSGFLVGLVPAIFVGSIVDIGKRWLTKYLMDPLLADGLERLKTSAYWGHFNKNKSEGMPFKKNVSDAGYKAGMSLMSAESWKKLVQEADRLQSDLAYEESLK